MARKVVCKKCGFINNPDDEFCAYCNNDISLGLQINFDKNQKHQFYNYLNKQFFDETPFEKENTNFIPEKETKKEEKGEIKNDLVKICPCCHYENKEDAIECEECGAFLRMVKPTQKQENQEIKEEIVDCNELDNNEFEYSLVIGVNGNNKINLVFENKRFIIGRNYQKCLENEMEVSRIHCYIKLLDDNRMALFESKNNPSTNHTYIKLNGGRLEQIEPGKGYIITNGDIFYLTKKIPVLLKKNI